MIANSYSAWYSGLVNKQNCGQTVLLRGPVMEKMHCKSCGFCVKKKKSPKQLCDYGAELSFPKPMHVLGTDL